MRELNRGALLSVLLMLFAVATQGQVIASGEDEVRAAAPGAQPLNERGPASPPDAAVVEKLYADAVAFGFGDDQIVDAEFSALVARAESYQLQRIYANAVLANAEPLSVVRQSLRELGHRRVVWEEWPAKKANVLYALSIVSGGEPDSVLRERLFAILDRDAGEPVAEEEEEEGKDEGLASVSQPFCDAECGPDDPEHPFNIYETDMYGEWLLWHEWYHGGPCPSCWIPWELLVDAQRIEALISSACAISS